MKRTLWAVAGVLTFFVLIFVGLVVGGVIEIGAQKQQAIVAKATNRSREQKLVFNPSRTLSTYEGFYDACRTVVADGQKITLAKTNLKQEKADYKPSKDPFGQQQESIQTDQANLLGLEQHQVDTAQQYNADASKNTRAPFKAADLPYTIDPPYSDVQCGSPKEGQR